MNANNKHLPRDRSTSGARKGSKQKANCAGSKVGSKIAKAANWDFGNNFVIHSGELTTTNTIRSNVRKAKAASRKLLGC